MKINKYFLFFFIVMIIASILFANPLFIAVVYTVAFVFFLDLITILVAESNLYAFDRYNIDQVEAGTRFRISYDIRNNSPLRVPCFCVKLSYYDNKEIVFDSLGPYQLKKVYEDVDFSHRGEYKLGKKSVYMKSLFGIITKRYVIGNDKIITVIPKEYNVNLELNGKKESNDISYDAAGTDNYNLKDIKEYVPGDSIKSINWRVSSRRNKLMVNLYEDQEGKSYYVFLDMNESNYDGDNKEINEEKMIDFTCSLCKNLMKQNEDVEVLINNINHRNFYINNKNDGYKELKNYLIYNKSNGQKNSDQGLYESYTLLPINCGLIIVVNILNSSLDMMIKKIIMERNLYVAVVCNKNIMKNSKSEYSVYFIDDLINNGGKYYEK